MSWEYMKTMGQTSFSPKERQLKTNKRVRTSTAACAQPATRAWGHCTTNQACLAPADCRIAERNWRKPPNGGSWWCRSRRTRVSAAADTFRWARTTRRWRCASRRPACPAGRWRTRCALPHSAAVWGTCNSAPPDRRPCRIGTSPSTSPSSSWL